MRKVTVASLVASGVVAMLLSAPVLADTFEGTRDFDVIVGTDRGDHIDVSHGPKLDWVRAKAGADVVKGGDTGEDNVYGGRGNDTIFIVGRAPYDSAFGGPGNDEIRTRDGQRDVIFCDEGVDHVVADKLDDIHYAHRDCEDIDRK
jgi:Ca2+-binding RTX toxin-like protein